MALGKTCVRHCYLLVNLRPGASIWSQTDNTKPQSRGARLARMDRPRDRSIRATDYTFEHLGIQLPTPNDQSPGIELGSEMELKNAFYVDPLTDHFCSRDGLVRTSRLRRRRCTL